MKKIIFVCAENAGRSQMAEAFFNYHIKGSEWVAESSGNMPVKTVNPLVVEAMQEKGLDISDKKPKLFDPQTIGDYARVISFGCLVKSAFADDVQRKIEDWDVGDPREKPLEEVRKIRDEIDKRIKALIQQLSTH